MATSASRAAHHQPLHGGEAAESVAAEEVFDRTLAEWERVACESAKHDATARAYAILIEANMTRLLAYMRDLRGPVAAAVEASCTLAEFLHDRSVRPPTDDDKSHAGLDAADADVGCRLRAVFLGSDGKKAVPPAPAATGQLTSGHDDARVRFSRTLDAAAVEALLPCLHRWLASAVAAGADGGSAASPSNVDSDDGAPAEPPAGVMPGWTATDHVAIPLAILDAASGLPAEQFFARRDLRATLRNLTVDLHDVADECPHGPSAALCRGIASRIRGGAGL